MVLAEITMLRGLYCPHKVILKGTASQVYHDWYEHLSPTTRHHIWFQRFGLLFPEPKTNSRNQQIGQVPHS